ncbi:zinc ribbon domain-containing protein [Halalkalicoccus subterraneus]|uniref:zinc ribbon domain-containing protein n=1 Tax=Halalkalicoccus subterraneus TaxID=2675002 RepID=UPI000EFCB08F|nr:zinc ribbon domain-containing protein [Halalkalicoccus subterraneus]
MSQSVSQKRPWLAALLGALATGVGHIYLRRWRRGFAWVGVLFAVTVLFVDSAVVETLANGTAVDPIAIAPILLVGGLSAADAYLLAHVHNAVARLAVTSDGQLTHCPHCGKELDTDLEFCHWCTTDLSELDEISSDTRDKKDDPYRN